MPDWGGILAELICSKASEQELPDFDGIRRKYLAAVAQHTGRSVILYGAKFTQPIPRDIGPHVAISDEDIQGIMSVLHGLPGPKLDLILHSPGGSPDAAESIVSYLRSKFDDIRVVVPNLAMSAATMIACAANAIVLGKHSFLGPIDPQILIPTRTGGAYVAAQAILEDFQQAQRDCRDPRAVAAWLPILDQYCPGLLTQCKHAIGLSEELVRGWLRQYMFEDRKDGIAKSRQVAKWLADHKRWKSHGRKISRDVLEQHGLNIVHLEDDPREQDLYLSVFHATTHTFEMTTAIKIIENHLGKAFVRQVRLLQSQPPSSPAQHPLPSDGPLPARQPQQRQRPRASARPRRPRPAR